MSSAELLSDGGSAFPCEGGPCSGLHSDPGMSLRDYFAAAALTGVMAEAYGLGAMTLEERQRHMVEAAGMIFEMADAMLKARAPARCEETPQEPK